MTATTPEQAAADAERIHAELEARARTHHDDEGQRRRSAGVRAAAAATRARLAELGTTHAAVRHWATTTGRTDQSAGPAPAALIEAYARAHHAPGAP